MNTVQTIIEMHGGLQKLQANYIRIENKPYMCLVIEYVGAGPHDLPLVSVCHYGEQNGDLMRDPEMCFEIDQAGDWHPTYFRTDYMGIEQNAVYKGDDGRAYHYPRLVKQLKSFAKTWSKNLKEQGFIEAYSKQAAAAAA
jgi:hypothetical protein